MSLRMDLLGHRFPEPAGSEHDERWTALVKGSRAQARTFGVVGCDVGQVGMVEPGSLVRPER